MGLKASKAFFSGFMNSIFKAPMIFFDSTPVGRILTRASSDLSVLDFNIPFSILFVVAAGVELLVTIGIMTLVTRRVLIEYYIATARELIRISGTTKAPVMNYTAETSLGVVTIRAFNMVDSFFQNYLKLVDTDAVLFFHSNGVMEWVVLRIEAIQNVTIHRCSSPCFKFMNIPPEPPSIVEDNKPPSSWPSKGSIELKELKIRYRPNAPLVLKGITCTFNEGTKVGVVGRTGSGKRALISALFRLVEPVSGRILIDQLDICSMGLKDLRLKLSIIPQEPTHFRGSVRTNLDPLGLYADDEIWKVNQSTL
ncbi:hypothetical protein LWI28_020779 [Acer negundo]|uniref:ABC transmembrane type-1 domain-containing protein n=1 Tax=Acer negundo TaxID=4023 RepID=A0AAD5NK09_ACENE|nr:hypothetical protein LWI28_020779 [Acer negundo]